MIEHSKVFFFLKFKFIDSKTKEILTVVQIYFLSKMY